MGSEKQDLCPRPRAFANKETGEIHYSPCLTWACSSCGPKRRAELSLRIRRTAPVMVEQLGESAQWLTLTLDPKRNGASAANGTKRQARYVSKCWRALTSRWRERCRRAGTAPPWYVKVCEWRDTTAAMHLHCLIVGWLPGSIRGDIIGVGFGQSFHIERVKDVTRLARYLTTYVTKIAKDQAPRYVHRYSASRGALPTLALWKRLIRAGYLDGLRNGAEWGFGADAVNTNQVWWTGDGLKRLEAWLDHVEKGKEFEPMEVAYLGRVDREEAA